jgi:hypothetical protein
MFHILLVLTALVLTVGIVRTCRVLFPSRDRTSSDYVTIENIPMELPRQNPVVRRSQLVLPRHQSRTRSITLPPLFRYKASSGSFLIRSQFRKFRDS